MTALQERLDGLARLGLERAARVVELVLDDAVRRRASDVHFEPTPRGVEIRYRLDGVLCPTALLPRELAPNLVARLKVLAELLTYRVDVPQEGSFRRDGTGDLRVSTFPTIHGEKVVVRMFDASPQLLDLDQLGLPDPVLQGLHALLRERNGAIFLTGPSGSGKTTTIYASLRHLVRFEEGRHVVTLEDPVEQVIEGVSQSQAKPGGVFDFARGLRSLLRQDPEVIVIGEVRDRETAEIALQAALTGHLVISTLHAGSACGVIGRLLDMGLEPYLLTSTLKGVLNQRLVRACCQTCTGAGCSDCTHTGYHGRLLLAELLVPNQALRRAILARADLAALEACAPRADIWSAGLDAVARNRTTRRELERILGPAPSNPS